MNETTCTGAAIAEILANQNMIGDLLGFIIITAFFIVVIVIASSD